MRTSTHFKGGITGAMKVAHLAESHGLKAQVHGMGIANANICAAIPNNDFYEQLVMSTEQIKGLRRQSGVPVIDGSIFVPESPGLGSDIEWERIERTAEAVI